MSFALMAAFILRWTDASILLDAKALVDISTLLIKYNRPFSAASANATGPFAPGGGLDSAYRTKGKNRQKHAASTRIQGQTI